MSAPDHRPYLRERDLRTAEDVLAWLTRYVAAPGGTGTMAPHDLAARLDRERRQACRRGALEEWRRMSSLIVNGDVSSDGMDSFAYASDGGEGAIIVLASDHLAAALAFRAAARTP